MFPHLNIHQQEEEAPKETPTKAGSFGYVNSIACLEHGANWRKIALQVIKRHIPKRPYPPQQAARTASGYKLLHIKG